MRSEDPGDEAIASVRTLQWVDWTDLRFTERESGEYRRAVARLAQRLVDANSAAERVDVRGLVDGSGALPEDLTDDDGLGIVDRVARTEEVLPALVGTVEEMGEQIVAVAEIMRAANAEVEQANDSPKPMAARLTILHRIRVQLEDPARQIRDLGNRFTRQLHDVDDGVRVLVSMAPDEVQSNPDSREPVCSFFASIEGMARQTGHALSELQTMVEATRGIEGLSRDIRPVMRTLREGLTVMVEGREIVMGWIALIAASPVDCGGAS